MNSFSAVLAGVIIVMAATMLVLGIDIYQMLGEQREAIESLLNSAIGFREVEIELQELRERARRAVTVLVIGGALAAVVASVHIKALGRELQRSMRTTDDHQRLLTDMLKRDEKTSMDIKQLQAQLQMWAAKESKDKGD